MLLSGFAVSKVKKPAALGHFGHPSRAFVAFPPISSSAHLLQQPTHLPIALP